MNDFLEELLELACKRIEKAKSQSEKSNWCRLAKKLDSLRAGMSSEINSYATREDLLYKYALWAAWMMNNRSPFHAGSIRRSRRMRPKMADKKRALPKPLHARMILTNNPNAKEYSDWMSRKPNIFERPI